MTDIVILDFVNLLVAGLHWQPGAPPANWRVTIRRWERLDTARAWAAVLAFAFFLTAAALQLAGSC